MTTEELRAAHAALRAETSAHLGIDPSLSDKEFILAIGEKCLALVEVNLQLARRLQRKVVCHREQRFLGRCEGA